jgi:hypothetical protein
LKAIDDLPANSNAGVVPVNDIAAILSDVCHWPPSERQALATRILQTLTPLDRPEVVSPERRRALRALVGIWQSENAPDDAEVKAIVESERLRVGG